MMAEALAWHEAPISGTSLHRAFRWSRRTTPSRSRPASANQISSGSQSPANTFPRPSARACPIASSSSSARTSSQTRRARRCPTGSPWRSGRDARQPSSTPTEPMCLNLEAVKAAEEIGAVVEEDRLPESQARPRLPVLRRLPLSAQKVPAEKADVVFAAHEIMFRVPPGARQSFGLVIVDEAFWPKGLTGTAASPPTVWRMNWRVPGPRSSSAPSPTDETMQLRDLIERLQGALAKWTMAM